MQNKFNQSHRLVPPNKFGMLQLSTGSAQSSMQEKTLFNAIGQGAQSKYEDQTNDSKRDPIAISIKVYPIKSTKRSTSFKNKSKSSPNINLTKKEPKRRKSLLPLHLSSKGNAENSKNADLACLELHKQRTQE